MSSTVAPVSTPPGTPSPIAGNPNSAPEQAGSLNFDESLDRLTQAFDEASAKAIRLETLKINKGQELKAANTSIDQK